MPPFSPRARARLDGRGRGRGRWRLPGGVEARSRRPGSVWGLVAEREGEREGGMELELEE